MEKRLKIETSSMSLHIVAMVFMLCDHLWGETFYFARQGFALLALLPIWLYRGKQGYHSKIFS